MEQRDNSGILFPETNKKNEKGPDFGGNITVGGVTYRLAGWKKQGKKGPFLSLAVSTKKPNADKDPFMG